jgi:hypothetical protein
VLARLNQRVPSKTHDLRFFHCEQTGRPGAGFTVLLPVANGSEGAAVGTPQCSCADGAAWHSEPSSSPVGEGRFAWSAVTRVLLTPDHLLIFLSGPQGFAIPRKQLPDTTIQDMKAFAEARASTTEPGAPRNGGPATSLGSTGAPGGPPSVRRTVGRRDRRTGRQAPEERHVYST